MKKILIIEDNMELRENTAEYLSLSNFDTITADNGQSGIDLAISDHPDLIISDINMPEMDGYAVLKALRNNESAKKIPFIFLTVRPERHSKEETGADVYITKPIDVEELLRIITGKLDVQNAA